MGGLSYGLPGGTFFITDRLNFSFPASSQMGVWALAAGIWLVLRARAASTAISVALSHSVYGKVIPKRIHKAAQ